eukprot:SAG11_NODE_6901_length_1229_cov_0.900000_2_plen_54_part_00
MQAEIEQLQNAEAGRAAMEERREAMSGGAQSLVQSLAHCCVVWCGFFREPTVQ